MLDSRAADGPHRLAVAAPGLASADAAERVALVGGNAVDAALAATFVAMVDEVGIVSLSSGAFVAVQPPDGAAFTVDGWMDVPGRAGPPPQPGAGRATWDVSTDYGGGVDITIGPGSVAVHGAVAALAETHRRRGRLPWREVVAPAVAVARDGFHLRAASRYYLAHVHESIFGWDDVSRAALHGPGGELTTQPVVLPDLAATLEQVAADPATFHTGAVADAISRDVLERGGSLGPDDLAAYRPVVRPGLPARSGPWRLTTTPPPSVGGACVAAMLSVLDDDARPPSAEQVVAAQRRVLGHRLAVLDHSVDLTADVAGYLDAIGSPSTAHVSATDADGLACAVTISSGYGSGMVARGTGVWLNNCLGEQELHPRGPGSATPGTRMLSNMAPTVGRRDDGATLAIGSPGADRITTAIVQVMSAFAAGCDLNEAVYRPRVHVHRAGRPEEEVRVETEPTMYFGGVGATVRWPDGRLGAAADPRREGAVRLVPAAG